jgi:drug/metabolite transporter (DMT)-like permease
MSKSIGGYCGIFLTILFTVMGQLMVKKGMMIIGSSMLDGKNIINLLIRALTNIYIITGFGSAFLAAMCWLITLGKLPLSYAFPLMGLTFVLVPIGAWIIYGEQITTLRWLGIIVIIFGVWLSSR